MSSIFVVQDTTAKFMHLKNLALYGSQLHEGDWPLFPRNFGAMRKKRCRVDTINNYSCNKVFISNGDNMRLIAVVIMSAYECGTVKSSSSNRLWSGGEPAMQGGWCHSGPSSTLIGLNLQKNPTICHGNK